MRFNAGSLRPVEELAVVLVWKLAELDLQRPSEKDVQLLKRATKLYRSKGDLLQKKNATKDSSNYMSVGISNYLNFR